MFELSIFFLIISVSFQLKSSLNFVKAMIIVYLAIFILLTRTSLQVTENCGRTQHPAGIIRCSNVTRPGDFPWLVEVRHKFTDKFLCNGHLISKRHVLTSTYCLNEELEEISHILIFVTVARHSLVSDSKNLGISINVKEIRLTSSSSYSYHATIAMLSLERSAHFTKNIQPICLNGDSCFEIYDRDKSNSLGTVVKCMISSLRFFTQF